MVGRTLQKFIFLLATLLFAGLAACDETPERPLRFGSTLWPGYEPPFIIGEFNPEADKTLIPIQFLSATEVTQAFRNGALDVIALTLDETITLEALGADVVIILIADISNGGDVILAREGINSVKDLAGKKVAVESTALGAFMLTRALEKNDMVAQDILPILTTSDRMVSIYTKGDVDAVVTFEPHRTKILRLGAKEVFTSRDMPGEIIDVVVVARSLLETRPEALKKFVDLWLEAIEIINTTDRADALIARRNQLTVEEVRESYEGLTLPNRFANQVFFKNDASKITILTKRLEKVLFKNHLIQHDIEVGQLYDGRFIAE
ncbi:MAG: ABC transporter substrate-binding protein [Parvibaculaceae bacterium]|nr:ABC transporter substrate-binding protein [Parvibaculaceae bacterium]